MFILGTWESELEGLQGIGVACAVAGVWYVVPYEIDEALDPNQWIVDNETIILADAPTKGVVLDVPGTVRGLLDEDRGLDAQQMIDDLEDIADLNEHFGLRKLIKALVLVQLDEFNRNRIWDGKPEITIIDLKTALRQKLKEIA